MFRFEVKIKLIKGMKTEDKEVGGKWGEHCVLKAKWRMCFEDGEESIADAVKTDSLPFHFI